MRYMVLALAIIATVAGTTATAAMQNYKWKTRPLLIFAASRASAQLAEQRRIVASRGRHFVDRDVVIVWVVGSNVSADLGPSPSNTAASLRSRYGVAANEFRAVLVGKDGGVKLSSAMPLPGNRLFDMIDAMPMRRDEMRKR